MLLLFWIELDFYDFVGLSRSRLPLPASHGIGCGLRQHGMSTSDRSCFHAAIRCYHGFQFDNALQRHTAREVGIRRIRLLHDAAFGRFLNLSMARGEREHHGKKKRPSNSPP